MYEYNQKREEAKMIVSYYYLKSKKKKDILQDAKIQAIKHAGCDFELVEEIKKL